MSGDHNMYQKPRSHVDDDIQYDEAQVQAMIKKAVRDERDAGNVGADFQARLPRHADDVVSVHLFPLARMAAAIRSRSLRKISSVLVCTGSSVPRTTNSAHASRSCSATRYAKYSMLSYP